MLAEIVSMPLLAHPMTRPLSNDLRERVVAAIVGGESCRSVASRFGVADIVGGEVVTTDPPPLRRRRLPA